ncbi:hypothetical protein [Pseudoclavibacter helvolus]|uniref:hypothetical protein n=1 Tax=Pseudoclavibacter helvolus TaxID=255205 RepID=UPI00373674F8
MPDVVHEDIELWLCADLRAQYAERPDCEAVVYVSNKERNLPAQPGELHVIVRDDSGPRRDLLLQDLQIGVSVIGDDLALVRRVARITQALLKRTARVGSGSPVADVPDDQLRGPWLIDEDNDLYRAYQTAGLSVVGQQL